jgi:hypothetical protein
VRLLPGLRQHSCQWLPKICLLDWQRWMHPSRFAEESAIVLANYLWELWRRKFSFANGPQIAVRVFYHPFHQIIACSLVGFWSRPTACQPISDLYFLAIRCRAPSSQADNQLLLDNHLFANFTWKRISVWHSNGPDKPQMKLDTILLAWKSGKV